VYVEFEEVLKTLREGNTATFHHPDGKKQSIGLKGSMDWTKDYSWEILIKGRWTINQKSNAK